jgi:uncharacterized protein (DUF1330 family)
VTVNPDALKQLAESDAEGPVVMLNLLKFRADGGREGYERYAETASRLVAERGGRILYAGQAEELLEGDEEWDVVALAEYPSRQAFLEMASSEEFQAVAPLREESLERAVLYATDPLADV